MSGFDRLQDLFRQKQLAALGVWPGGAEALQPAAILAADDDAALWRWFDVVPAAASATYAPSAARFFDGYKQVVAALVAGRGPLDPVASAQRKLAQWGDKPPAWSIGCAGMIHSLDVAPTVAFPFNADASPLPTEFGLFGRPSLDAIFASAAVHASVDFGHVFTFTCVPGDWYVSSALSLAYGCKGSSPWNPHAAISWADAFGPDGMLQRLLTGLVVASGLDAQVRSDATFDADEQRRFAARGTSRGLWPYYLPADVATTTATFDEEGRLHIVTRSDLATRSDAAAAIALAAIVSPIKTFLGR